MRTRPFIVLLAALIAAPQSRPAGEEADYNTPNPTGSPEISEGAARQRKEYFDRQDREHDEKYEVDTSGDDGKDDYRYKPG